MRKLGAVWAGVVLCVATTGVSAASIADFSADFSASINPNGAWTYGYAGSLGGEPVASTTLSAYGPGGVIKAWSPTGTFWPTVGANLSGASASFGAGDVVTLAAGQGLLHPGPQGEFAVVRYTVQSPVLAELAIAFEGVDAVGTTTDVHVLKNGVQIFGGLVDGYRATQSFAQTYQFAAGDKVDVFVGWGGNANFNDDSTGFRMTLAPVPEPGAGVLFAVGLAVLGCAVRRRMVR